MKYSTVLFVVQGATDGFIETDSRNSYIEPYRVTAPAYEKTISRYMLARETGTPREDSINSCCGSV